MLRKYVLLFAKHLVIAKIFSKMPKSATFKGHFHPIKPTLPLLFAKNDPHLRIRLNSFGSFFGSFASIFLKKESKTRELEAKSNM